MWMIQDDPTFYLCNHERSRSKKRSCPVLFSRSSVATSELFASFQRCHLMFFFLWQVLKFSVVHLAAELFASQDELFNAHLRLAFCGSLSIFWAFCASTLNGVTIFECQINTKKQLQNDWPVNRTCHLCHLCHLCHPHHRHLDPVSWRAPWRLKCPTAGWRSKPEPQSVAK